MAQQSGCALDDGSGLRVVNAHFLSERKCDWNLFDGYDRLSITVALVMKVSEGVSGSDIAWRGPGVAVSILTNGWSGQDRHRVAKVAGIVRLGGSHLGHVQWDEFSHEYISPFYLRHRRRRTGLPPEVRMTVGRSGFRTRIAPVSGSITNAIRTPKSNHTVALSSTAS